MDIGFNRQGQQPFVPGQAVSGDSRPDWQGLRSRLAAAHALRAALADLAQPNGSFDYSSAQALHGYEAGLEDVNLTALGYGKSDECIWGAVADDVTAGGRG